MFIVVTLQGVQRNPQFPTAQSAIIE